MNNPFAVVEQCGLFQHVLGLETIFFQCKIIVLNIQEKFKTKKWQKPLQSWQTKNLIMKEAH